ncbi:MAG: acyl-CoA desaturase, partial [Candidatus Hydrogenedentes bacterium]|nr:acyl-CoA desaturase [Candidatus Hydrogenedentota bacterium]
STWLVNSATHLWGYRNYRTSDNSRNTWWVALITFGEGWHNNHHADQRSAAHGHKWWEFDMTYITIKIMQWVGLARNVVHPGRLSQIRAKDFQLPEDLKVEEEEPVEV